MTLTRNRRIWGELRGIADAVATNSRLIEAIAEWRDEDSEEAEKRIEELKSDIVDHLTEINLRISMLQDHLGAVLNHLNAEPPANGKRRRWLIFRRR